jgi:L-alanine-DL-glutamate epimerase-like enolase superfamily enzyme
MVVYNLSIYNLDRQGDRVPRITAVEVVAAAPPSTEVRFTDALPAVHTTVTYVVLTDDTGAVGVGAVESDTFGGPDLGPLEALRPVAPSLLGLDPLRPAAVAALVASRLSSASRRVPAAAVEVACWDLLGRHAGLPLHRLLGGAREAVPAYASLPFEADLESLLALVGSAVAAGYPATKLHVSGDPATDVAAVAAVRGAFPDLGLIVDAESVYTHRGADRVGRALDHLDVLWFEAPLSDRDIAGNRRLTRSLRTPVVAAGGLIDDPRELASVLVSAPWSAVRTQTMEGGVGHVVQVAAVARAFGLDVELCSYGTTLTQVIDLQLILGLGLGQFYEQPFPTEPWAFGTTSPVDVRDGAVRAPTAPGLGVELDRSAILDASLARFGAADE